MTYQIGYYHDMDTNRIRWAVYDTVSRVWYFPKRYGQKSAQSMANRLNREAAR